MKKLMILSGIVAGMFLSLSTFAHEGHDHDAPSKVEAPKGGNIKSTEEFHVEVVAKGADIKVYLYELDLKPADASAYKVTLATELPRTKKSEPLTFKASGNMLEATFNAKSAHRYTLIVTAQKGEAHSDKLNFTIEPRK